MTQTHINSIAGTRMNFTVHIHTHTRMCEDVLSRGAQHNHTLKRETAEYCLAISSDSIREQHFARAPCVFDQTVGGFVSDVCAPLSAARRHFAGFARCRRRSDLKEVYVSCGCTKRSVSKNSHVAVSKLRAHENITAVYV